MPDARGGKPVVWLRRVAAGVASLACAMDAAALSSGAPRGTPLIGRPLQLSIPVAWERGDPPPCVRAEFLQGESPGGPLRWRLDQTSETAGLLRLNSALPVQEPVVTVQVALGCGQQLAREYVLLAEPPGEARGEQPAGEGADQPVALAPLALAPASGLASAGVASASASGKAAPAAVPARRTGGRGAAPASLQRTPRAGAAVQPATAPQRRRDPATPSATATSAATAMPASGAEARMPPARPGSRLTLEPIDIAIDEAPVLRLTGALTPSAPVAAAVRADARGLFQALNTSPEQQAAQLQAAEALQAEVKAMRELVQRYGAESRAATQRLETVSGERDLMLNILLGLVVVLGGGFGYLLWLRTRETAVLRRWWEEEHGAPPRTRPVKASPPAAAVPAPTALPEPQASVPRAEPEGPDSLSSVDLVDLPDFLDFDHARVLSVEELLGLKERADFFLAVGQPDKAVQLLESQLHEHASSPFVWLDLLDLCRRLERRDDYERLRLAFQKLFAARLPGFDAAMPESGGLADHPRALSRITQLWGTTRVLKMIEDSLFEDPKPGSITFDLEASRELLLLYGIASEALTASATRENFGGSFTSTMRSPLVDAPARAAETEPVPLADLDDVHWPASLDPQPARTARPEAAARPADDAAARELVAPSPARARQERAPGPAVVALAAAPDIDLGELGPLLPDLDFSLSVPPVQPERTR